MEDDRGSSESPLLDGALAALALLGTALVGRELGARILPAAVLAGGVATVAMEAALGRHHDRVRALWARAEAKVATVVVGTLTGGIALWIAPSPVASALGGGLAAYVCLLGLVRVGVLAPPRRWGRS